MKAVWCLMRHKAVITAFMAVMLVHLLPGCGGNSSECVTCSSDDIGQANNSSIVTRTIVSSVLAQQDQDGTTHFYTSAGKLLTSDQLTSMIKALPKDETKGMEIKVIPPSIDPKNPTTDPSRLWIPIPWTCYGIVLNWEKDYLGGCIKRDVWHLGFQVQNRCQGRMIFNSHAAAWWENGPQFGLYVTPSGWCRTTRGGYTAVRDALKDAMMAAGLGYTASALISNFTAPIMVPMLGL